MMYYARVMFEFGSEMYINDPNLKLGLEKYANKGELEFYRLIEKRKEGVHEHFRVSVFVGKFYNVYEAINEGKKLFYAILDFYFSQWGNIYIDTKLLKYYEDNRNHFITSVKNQYDDNTLQLVEVENNIEEYINFKRNIVCILSTYEEMPFGNFEENELLFDDEFSLAFKQIHLAQNTGDRGKAFEYLCTALESLSPGGKKSEEAIKLLDEFKDMLESSNLDKEEKDSLKGYIENGKNLGFIQKCRITVKRYAKDSYFCGGEMLNSETILKKAYSLRSKNTHWGKEENGEYYLFMTFKQMLLDIIRNKMKEKQN